MLTRDSYETESKCHLRENRVSNLLKMFGNLFEEEEEDFLTSTSTRGRAAKGGDEPPAPRGRSNLCGIKNQGGTCYLNSLLQTLLFTPEFRGKAWTPFPVQSESDPLVQ